MFRSVFQTPWRQGNQLFGRRRVDGYTGVKVRLCAAHLFRNIQRGGTGGTEEEGERTRGERARFQIEKKGQNKTQNECTSMLFAQKGGKYLCARTLDTTTPPAPPPPPHPTPPSQPTAPHPTAANLEGPRILPVRRRQYTTQTTNLSKPEINPPSWQRRSLASSRRHPCQ